MKIENQVCTLEQAKRLKELGVLQYSYFSWCGEEGQRLMDNGRDGMAVQEWVFVANTEPVNNMQADHRENVPGAKPFAAAYSVAELGEMLPPEYCSIRCETHGSIGWESWQRGGLLPLIAFATEAECRATLLIRLIESKLITVEQVNKRITQ